MTLIEDREVFEAPKLGKRSQDPNPFDDSGSDDEYSIANEGYNTDNGENNNNRDFFSLPTLGLNYLNNLNLSLNLNLNLRNSSLWRIYENSPFPKTGFLSNYLSKHGEEDLDLNGHDINSDSDSRSYSALTNFLRQTFQQAYEAEYSEEAILERVRFKELQRQAAAERKQRRTENKFISEFHLSEKENSHRLFDTETSYFEKGLVEVPDSPECEQESGILQEKDCLTEEIYEDLDKQDMSQNADSTPLNPFYNRVKVPWYKWVEIILIGTFLAPIKFTLMIVCLLFSWVLSSMCLFGVTIDDHQKQPLSLWRRGIRWLLANVFMRLFVFCAGFIWTIKGKERRATPEKAPIFVVGPHSSFFDSFAVILIGAPSVVAKESTKDIPIFGKMVSLTQAVYVAREQKGSRKATMETLKKRAQDVYHGNGMPQIFIFPEGTCSNRSSLIKFKPGAFAPQVPVQPVVIRYPNHFDSVTWTFDGVPVLRNIYFSLAQLFNRIEIEYLPVYVPTEAEKNNSTMYAENVRRVMARALDIPVTEYQFEDGTLLYKMRDCTHLLQKFRSIDHAKKALKLETERSTRESELLRNPKRNELLMGFQQFQSQFFQVRSGGTIIPEVQAVFNNFKKDGNDEADIADIRSYLLLTCILYEDRAIRAEDFTTKLCQLFDSNPAQATDENLKELLRVVFEVSDQDVPLIPPSQMASREVVGDVASVGTNISEPMRQRAVRYLEFAKLLADEVAGRHPHTYPSREQRDKLPNMKQKSD